MARSAQTRTSSTAVGMNVKTRERKIMYTARVPRSRIRAKDPVLFSRWNWASRLSRCLRRYPRGGASC